jgi:Leucine rich repeat
LTRIIKFLEAKEVSCESVADDTQWIAPVLRVKTCNMRVTTSIDSPETIIISSAFDSSMGGLRFDHNKQVYYLPENVGEKFPNLLAHYASFCNVKEISKKHFKNLSKLKFLGLDHNQIETILSDTFEDLIELEILWLSKWLAVNKPVIRSNSRIGERVFPWTE